MEHSLLAAYDISFHDVRMLVVWFSLASGFAVMVSKYLEGREAKPPKWDRYEEDYPPPTPKELAEIEASKMPGAFRIRARSSAVARHFFTATQHTRISSTGGRQTIHDDPPNIVDEWYDHRD